MSTSSVDLRRIGGALLLAVALSLVGVTAWAEEKPAKAEKAEKKAPPEEAVPAWVNWLNAGLPFNFGLIGLDIEGGVRGVGGDNDAAKFQEYRVIEDGAFLDHMRLSLETKDKKRYVEFSTFDAFKNDQRYNLRAGKYGEYELEIFWDQIPHRLSSTGRTLFNTTLTDSTASLTLPPGVASTVQAASATGTPSPRALALAGFLTNARPVDLAFTTSKGGFGLKYNLTDSLDMGVRYTYTEKDGTIPMGAGFGGPGGNIVELPAPLFNRTHQVEAKTQYARPGWNIGLGYAASLFDQGIDSISFDNPLSATNSTTLSARGRTTMDPSNQAHNVFLTGGISLPLRTRITGKVSYGWRFQDDPFVQHTINPVLLTDPRLALPHSSLDGDVRTTLVTLNATSRPLAMLPLLALSGGYRFYDFDNQTPEIEFDAHVVRDLGPVVVDTRVTSPYSYTKHNARLDGSYPLLSNLNFKLGYEWERWERDPRHREVPTSDEHFLKTSFDFTPNDWLLLRAAYRRSWRDIDKYNPQAHNKHVALDIEEGDPAEALDLQGQNPLLRKFDQADRTRDRVELMASISPLETLNFTATYSLLYDDFDKSRSPETFGFPGQPASLITDTSPLGLQESRGWSAGGDLAYTPFPWLSFFANYVREEFKYDQLSRSRPVITNLPTATTTLAPGCDFSTPGAAVSNAVCDFVDFNWRSVNRDTVDTYGVGADVSLIPNRLNLRLSYSFSDADTEINSFNPVTPTSGTAAQRTTATAFNFPVANTNLHTLIAALRYNLTKNLSVKGEYRWEQFDETDWGTDAIGLSGSTAFPPTTNVFLGARFLQDYDAHIGAFTLRYQF
jgi:MtrB/PioB family decaheme-associated outer membrane protein